MGIYQDTFDALKGFEILSIDGQPTDDDINKLTAQLTEALAAIPTGNGGGKHGHIGIVVNDTKYRVISGGTPFTIPTRPGAYPDNVSDDDKTREKQVAEHKAEIEEYETYRACQAWARQTIVKAVDEEWLLELRDEDIGYQHKTPIELLDHLRDAGGDLNDLEIAELNTELMKPWDGVEAPVTMFTRADKYEKQLERHGIPKQPELRLSYSVATFKTSGQFDPAMREWEARAGADKTFAKFRTFIQREYTKQVKGNKSTAGAVGKGIANKAAEEEYNMSAAEATALTVAEVANALQASNQEQMKQMMEMFQTVLTQVGQTMSQTPAAPKAPGGPRQSIKPCPHCKKKHRDHSKCWELETNKASRPEGWKSVKST